MMGQHHFNPTAIAAKEGRLPPKPKKMSKCQQERLLRNLVDVEMGKRIFGVKEAGDNGNSNL